MESLWALLGFEPKSSRGKRGIPSHALPETESVRKIFDAIENLDPVQARYLAAFAYLLSRVANADRGTSEEEFQAIEGILSDKGNLTGEQAALVAEIARNQAVLFGSTENFLVGREFDKIATHEQKLTLLHCLYAVSAADKSISSTEDHEIRKISRELKLEHEDYIAVRLAYREHLAVLKKIPGARRT
jgi:uncharacterized tellurite resistance protein B-like protein